MYKLQFTLKQHTPLIHFQHEQDGATLRATEVKPKLDRFILMRLGKEVLPNENDSDTIYKKGIEVAKVRGLLIGNGDKPALDYKIKIEVNGKTSKYFITSNPQSGKNDDNRRSLIFQEFGANYINQTQYFGNNENLKNQIEKKDEVKLGLMCDGVEIHIQSFNYDLYNCFYDNQYEVLKTFFVLNTFGTRQTKGFGCFLPENISDTDIKKYLAADANFLGVFKKSKAGSFEDKLQTIANDYSLLKRGKSHGGYQKSKLWEYLCATQKIRWEKRKIKTHLIASDKRLFDSLKYESGTHQLDDCEPTNDNNVYQYIRALLGLAEQYEFVKMNSNDRLKVKISDASPDKFKMDRFKSPIRYMVTDKNIYLVAYRIPTYLQSYTDDTGNVIPRNINFEISGVPSFQLTIPTNFNLLDFLEKKSGYIKL